MGCVVGGEEAREKWLGNFDLFLLKRVSFEPRLTLTRKQDSLMSLVILNLLCVGYFRAR